MRAIPITRAVAAAALALMPVSAWAQDDVADRANELAEQANEVQAEASALANEAASAEASRDEALADGTDRDGDGFPWGLLGLLGLAGLLGLRRPDRVGVDGGRDRL